MEDPLLNLVNIIGLFDPKYARIVRYVLRILLFGMWYWYRIQACGLNRPNRTQVPLEPIVVSRRAQIDLIDMRHQLDRQLKCICHLKDRWSKLRKITPSTLKTVEVTTDAIFVWIYPYGPPEMMQLDNGSKFKTAVEILLYGYGVIDVEHHKYKDL